MSESRLNIRMEKNVKDELELVCEELGISMSAAINMFAKKMIREKRIPFEVSIDPFYSESNMKYIKEGIEKIEKGEAKLEEHDLIEE